MKRAKNYPLKTEKVLSADLLTAAAKRFLVANYYQSQDMRKRLDMQRRHLGDRIETMDEKTLWILNYTGDSYSDIEEQMAKMFVKMLTSPVDLWLKAQRGIGPIIAVGLTAHLDVTKAPTAGHFWSFSGLNPEMKWNPGEKRPFNADLKQICYQAGISFMRNSNDPDCFYGRLYRERKAFEIKRNDAGGNAERAANFVVKGGATKSVKDKLSEGKLPDFNIDARARRHAVKIFLSHLHAIMYWDHFKRIPPKPFAVSILGHAHEIRIPNMDLFPGFEQAYYGGRYDVAAE